MKLSHGLILLIPLSFALAACGSDTAGNELDGSVKTTFNLEFDYVEIFRQDNKELPDEFDWKVMYVKEDKSSKRWPAIVVGTAPVKEGQAVKFPAGGSITHVVDGAEFPELKDGEILFETLGEVGDTASGKFFGTFVNGGTINGEFSATIQGL